MSTTKTKKKPQKSKTAGKNGKPKTTVASRVKPPKKKTARKKGRFKDSFHTYRNDALGDLDCVGLSEALKKKEITTFEVVEAAVERTRDCLGPINPIAEDCFERALDAAKTGRTPAGDGVFAGLPSFIKDNEEFAGLSMRQGCSAIPKKTVKKNSAFVNQYLSLGMNILGKTTMPEFGFSAITESRLHGATRNPWNTNRTPGGSSGGSAALVAAGAVPIAHGNDGGGSIRIPAAACGLVGLRPTRARLHNLPGTDVLPVNIVSQGAMTRTVRDTAHFMAEMEKSYKNKKLPAVGLVEHPGRKRLRVAWFVDNPEAGDVDPIVRGATEETAGLLESLGHHVDQIPYPFDPKGGDKFVIYYGMLSWIVSTFGALSFGRQFSKKNLEPISLGLRRYFIKNSWKIPAVLNAVRRHTNNERKVFQQYDVLMSPVLTHQPPEIGYIGHELDFETMMPRLHRFACYTPAQNASGAPAISLPMGFDEEGHLPVGIQFSAGLGHDRTLLELAYELEEARPFRHLYH